MIHNGHDYQPYNSVVSLSTPGYLYIYYALGQIGTATVDSISSRITNVDIETVGYQDYAFVDAYYSTSGSFQEEVDIRIDATQDTPAYHKFFGWTTIVGATTYTGPIWKDYIYTVPFQASRVQYKVRYNGNDIFKGWAYEIGQSTEICINDIARDYLHTEFPDSEDVWYQDYNAVKTFELYTGPDESSEPTVKAADLTFKYDWSYSYYYLNQYDSWLAMEPLQDFYDSRQFHIFSVNTYATLTNRSTIQYVNLNDARSHIKTQLPSGSYRLYSYEAPELKIFRFDVRENCGIRYCLYYVNSRGGWDSVLVDGVATQTDKYDRETYTQNYRTPSINRGVIEYRNNITESWTLYLRSLGDSRNKLFHNLYESTNVYLHDLEEDRIVPVIITSREMQYKTRKNQGKKLYTYEIQVESSQRKLRM